MTEKPRFERVAFSPGEFAALCGKSQTWGYRQIYAGKVKAITEHGRIMIPAVEVDHILKTAGIYDGLRPKPTTTKAEVQRMLPKHPDAWKTFLAKRRQSPGGLVTPGKQLTPLRPCPCAPLVVRRRFQGSERSPAKRLGRQISAAAERRSVLRSRRFSVKSSAKLGKPKYRVRCCISGNTAHYAKLCKTMKSGLFEF